MVPCHISREDVISKKAEDEELDEDEEENDDDADIEDVLAEMFVTLGAEQGIMIN